MTLIDIRAKIDEDEAARKLPAECILDQVKTRRLTAEVLVIVEDNALLAELHDRELGVEALVKEHDADELVRLLRRWQPELVTLDGSSAGELLDLLAWAAGSSAKPGDAKAAAAAAYELLRAANPQTDNIDGRAVRLTQQGTLPALL